MYLSVSRLTKEYLCVIIEPEGYMYIYMPLFDFKRRFLKMYKLVLQSSRAGFETRRKRHRKAEFILENGKIAIG
jgi:hypothetical protein